ncbi:MAG: asparagine synthase (glutamine-hydrolyzing) [Acidobacteria bacterium]|nr:MAG: asparagine synthase (glutamine-hydrolyzing) [Acidobacteriota bacterium]
MCGIAGILGHPDRDAVERMMEAMLSRGPDDGGIYQDDAVALGLRRLSILDLSSAGRQPMSRANDRLWIVYNGEIYNFRELRRELEGRGHQFESRTDTEVILALYEDMGAECVSRLRGMFAFAIWDRRGPDPFLFLARDHFGIKPLVYRSTPGCFLFASDLPGLLASGRIATDVDELALVQYLQHGHVIQPWTILQGVRMLPPAHAMIVRPGEAPHLWRYWDLDQERCASLSRGMDLREQVIALRSLLLETARRQMVSDVPLGAFLSGGCDSSSLVALMMKSSGRPVHTFAIGYAGVAPELDETADAARAAHFLGSIHRNVEVTGQEVLDVLPEFATQLGQPTMDGLNMYFASRAARSEVTVALAGTGADEIFAGYHWFNDLERVWGAGGSRPGSLVSALCWTRLWTMLPRSEQRETWELRALRRDLASNYAMHHMIRPPSEALRLAGSPKIDRDDLLAYCREDDPAVKDLIARVSRLDIRTYLCSQLLRDADAASMACSLEMRVPFLEVELVEFAYGLPGASKFGVLENGGPPCGKWVFLQAMKDLIPEASYRKPKRGFSMPYGQWLEGPLRPLVDDVLTDGAFRSIGLLEPREMDRLRERFLAGHEARWARVWTVLMLGLWWRGLKSRSRTSAQSVKSTPVLSVGGSPLGRG